MNKSDVERVARAIADAAGYDFDQLKKFSMDDMDQEHFLGLALAALSSMNPMREALETAQALVDDVKRRYPGEDLRCPLMRRLDEALAALQEKVGGIPKTPNCSVATRSGKEQSQ